MDTLQPLPHINGTQAHHQNGNRDRRGSSVEEDIYDVHGHDSEVLVIYTGGTIGMIRDKSGALVPAPGLLHKKIRTLPQLHDDAYAKKYLSEEDYETKMVLSYVDQKRIVYTIKEWSDLIDSSDMTIDEWIHIANDIRENYTKYNGFVVLHGTDTMSYTASALSYMLENLGKPVVVTGSQIPIFEPRSDGSDNFVSSLIVAGTKNIPEVTLFFGSKLFRGNRTSKNSSDNFDAFHSPNCEPLAAAGIQIEVNPRAVFRQLAIEPFRAHTVLNRNVALIRIFPSITGSALHAFLQPPIEGVVLQTYGAGNIPLTRKDFHHELKSAIDRGVIIVNITQCIRGSVQTLYKTGQCLVDTGVIPGYDMTPEAALTKLSYILSKNEWSLEKKRLMMQISIRGELTSTKTADIQDYSLIENIGRCFGVSTQQEASTIAAKSALPALMSYAAFTSKPDVINKLKVYGADVNDENVDGRTALHIAACIGDINTLDKLLSFGANVHVKDKYGNTPLMDAIHCEHSDAVKLLLKCGSHFLGSDLNKICAEILSAAGNGSSAKLSLYKMAAAKLDITDAAGRTALHIAALHGQEETVLYLIDHGLSVFEKDIFGFTPYDYAKQKGYTSLAQNLSIKLSNLNLNGNH